MLTPTSSSLPMHHNLKHKVSLESAVDNWVIVLIFIAFWMALMSGCVSRDPVRIASPSVELMERLSHLKQDQIVKDTTRLLTQLIQAQSVNPPGYEERVTTLLTQTLADVGIQSQQSEIAPHRQSLYAILSPKSDHKNQRDHLETLCLLSHSDVVPADQKNWRYNPWRGVVKDGYVWGRGALDMKGIMALHVVLMKWVKRMVDSGSFSLKRRLALIVVADEEVNNLGMRELVKNHWDDLRCDHVINEGAFGVRDLLFPNQDVMPISVGEKGVLWVKLIVEAVSGHGSIPQNHYAPKILLDALGRIRAYRSAPVVSEALTELFHLIGDDYGGFTGFVLKRPLLTRWFTLDDLLSIPESAAGISDTFHITGLNTGQHKPNVVPASASALLDIRMIAGVQPDVVLKNLKEIIKDDRVKVEVIHAIASNVSAWREDPIYHAIVRHSRRVFPNAVVGPATSVGFTDSTYARQAGANAYGWAPFMLTRAELETMHGDNERLPLKQITRGVDAMLGLLLETTLSLQSTTP